MVENPKVTCKETHRFPYLTGESVKCPDCGEMHELKRISETTGAFECLKCKKVFHVR